MSALPLRFFFCMSIGGWPRPAAQHGHGPAAWGQRLPGHDLRPPQAQGQAGVCCGHSHLWAVFGGAPSRGNPPQCTPPVLGGAPARGNPPQCTLPVV
eukprot:1156090-Pelagomonas_calceolata.AAC.8